jgi:protein-S-isoprenylcysteine O-methyltransferase Ste14
LAAGTLDFARLCATGFGSDASRHASGDRISIRRERRTPLSRYLRWSRTEHREPTRIAVMIVVAPVFLGLLPTLVGVVGRRIDREVGLRPLPYGMTGRVLGGALAATGFSLGFWSVGTQLDRGRGTPLPVMPTQELLTDGPFRYCRNPMTLGAISAYLGIALMARTATGAVIALSLGALLLAYLKLLEEPELAERFGAAYLAYRRSTPFIVPRLTRRSRRGGKTLPGWPARRPGP